MVQINGENHLLASYNSQNIPINPVRMINEEFIEVSQNDIRSIMSLLNALSNANEILMN